MSNETQQKVGKEKLDIKPGFLYFVKKGEVWQTPMRGKTGEKKVISKETVQMDSKNFVYFVKDGYVCRAPRAKKGEGGAKKPAAPKKGAEKKGGEKKGKKGE